MTDGDVTGHPLLNEIRDAELDAALESFPPPPARVLEIGAGSGWQASLLESRGYEVDAVDIDCSEARHHTVLPYDGVRLPFGDDSFDVVFSSNVLEHVVDLPGLLAETDRVRRPESRSVHLMPTTTWRALTILTFYLSLPRRFRTWRTVRDESTAPVVGIETTVADRPSCDDGVSKLRRISALLRSSMIEAPHGEFSSALSELAGYRIRSWRRRLKQSPRSITVYPAGVVYTGYGIAPWVSLYARRRLAKLLGSSCYIYVDQPLALPDLRKG